MNKNDEMQNAYQFIIDSLNDNHSIDEIRYLDNASILEFADQYFTTFESIQIAINTMMTLASRIS